MMLAQHLLIRHAVQTFGAEMALELNVLTRSGAGEDAGYPVASRAALSDREELLTPKLGDWYCPIQTSGTGN
jgi:hypothetical protein